MHWPAVSIEEVVVVGGEKEEEESKRRTEVKLEVNGIERRKEAVEGK